MNISFESIGWISKVAQKRATFSISILKPIVLGSCLEKGQPLYCYAAKDEQKRPIMLVYLDGKQKRSGKGT